MILNIDSDLENALKELAHSQGVAPEVIAINALRESLLAQDSSIEPQDEWERNLLSVAKNCEVSLPDSALTREEIYE